MFWMLDIFVLVHHEILLGACCVVLDFAVHFSLSYTYCRTFATSILRVLGMMLSSTDQVIASPNCLLKLPLEIRMQIWRYLLTPMQPLIMRSLFIRTYYRSIFMTQQTKQICISILRVCKQITEEALPILYSQPYWRAACRVENLASQIGIENLALIKKMMVDPDDLPSIVGSLLLDLQEKNAETGNPGQQTASSVELKLELESRAVLENLISSGPSQEKASLKAGTVTPWTPLQRRLRFSTLEMLEVEGYQSMALTDKGTRKSRLEGLRLCKFAKEILSYHPNLTTLVQAEKRGNGGSDAVDMAMGRVKWRFIRNEGWKVANEHIVDLDRLEELLKAIVELGETDGRVRGSRQVPSWSADGRFHQYPYLVTAAAIN